MAIRQISLYQYDAAVDNLFYIQANNTEFKEGAVKKMIVSVNPDLAQEIKRKLANLLFG